MAGHSLAVTSNGTAWAWGYNFYGQLGDSTTTDRSTPVAVSGLTGVSQVAAGYDSSLALKSDGTVWAWGSNFDGQLGDGTTTNRTTPVQAVGASDIASISAGWSHSLAVQTIHAPAATTSYTYDEVNRLTISSTSDGSSDARVYDPAGNQTSVTIDGVQNSAIYNAANELTALGGTTYTYDNNGNRLTATSSGMTTTYGYDARNELTSVSGPVTASYTYNGAGERVSKTVGGTTTTYTWDPTGLGTVIADGTVENVFGPTGLAEQVDDTSQTTQFASADALGSIRLITDGSGNVVGSGSYSAWGMPDSGSVTLGGFGFTSEQVDPESGLVYLRNRYYDPTTGRFLTPDPLGFLGSGVNLYTYVGNGPTTSVDPSGLFRGEKLLHRGFQSTRIAQAVGVADTVAIAIDTTAVGITATATIIGCAGGGIAGCGAGYLTGVFLAQPLNNISAEYAGTAGVILGCVNTGLLSEDCRSSVEKQALGFLIPDPTLDLAWDINIAHGDSQSLHSLEDRQTSGLGPAPKMGPPIGIPSTGMPRPPSNSESPANACM